MASQLLEDAMARWNANIKGVDADVDNASAVVAALVAANTQETMQDQVRSLLAHNAHTNLTASYDDAANRVTLGLPPKYKTVLGSGGRNIADTADANTLNPSE